MVKKQGGNVASYFTLSDGRVLHVVVGPVAAATLLNEARWVVETRKLAVMKAQGNDAKYKTSWGRAHAERLQAEHGIAMNSHRGKQYPASRYFAPGIHSGISAQAKIHSMLANAPLSGIDKIYRDVFEKVLNQRTSNLPVIGEMDGKSSPGSKTPATASIRFRQPIIADAAVADLRPQKETVAEDKSTTDERTASRQLKLALMLVLDAKKARNRLYQPHDAPDGDQLLALASDHFREIVQGYPRTRAAQEARRLLGEE